MLYNKKLKSVKTNKACLNCEYFDKVGKTCSGLNKQCFEYDPITGTIVDGITKLPIKIKE